MDMEMLPWILFAFCIPGIIGAPLSPLPLYAEEGSPVYIPCLQSMSIFKLPRHNNTTDPELLDPEHSKEISHIEAVTGSDVGVYACAETTTGSVEIRKLYLLVVVRVSIQMKHVTPNTLRLEGHVTYLGHPRVPRADQVFWRSSNNHVPKYEDTLKYEHTIIRTRHTTSMVLNIYHCGVSDAGTYTFHAQIRNSHTGSVLSISASRDIVIEESTTVGSSGSQHSCATSTVLLWAIVQIMAKNCISSL